jgi:hypothetical protein
MVALAKDAFWELAVIANEANITKEDKTTF